eukprot:g9803.t1
MKQGAYLILQLRELENRSQRIPEAVIHSMNLQNHSSSRQATCSETDTNEFSDKEQAQRTQRGMQALVVLGLSLIHFAAGHGALWFPVPREGRVAVASRTVGSYPTNDPAVLQGCGTGVKTDQDGEPSWRNTFLQGSFINVEWHVEKPHPAVGGWDEKIRIALKPLGSGSFADHILLANSTNDISGSLALNETRLRKGEVQVRIQLPDEPNCTKCIF